MLHPSELRITLIELTSTSKTRLKISGYSPLDINDVSVHVVPTASQMLPPPHNKGGRARVELPLPLPLRKAGVELPLAAPLTGEGGVAT